MKVTPEGAIVVTRAYSMEKLRNVYLLREPVPVRSWVSDEFLDQAATGQYDPSGIVVADGALTIASTNFGTVTWRIGEYDSQQKGWRLVWPD